LVHELKLGDDVEPNLRELVLKHLEEHGEKVVDSSEREIRIEALFAKTD
jgi:hypothetical protein